MAHALVPRVRQARRAIVGFGCNQAFLFAMLYLGSFNESAQHGFLIDRADLLFVLLVMAATFALMARERSRRRLVAAADGLVRCYALPLAVALYLLVALHGLMPGIPWLALAAAEGLVAGVSLALLLCQWGRVLGEASIDQSVPEVFIGSALGAAVCFFVVAIPVEGAYILLYVLPAGSAWALRALGESGGAADGAAPADAAERAEGRRASRDGDNVGGRGPEPTAADAPTDEAAKLSGRIVAGTVVYGVATGAVEALGSSAEGAGTSSLSVTFVLFVLYCAAALQLYGGRPGSLGVRAVLPTGPDQEVGPLGGAYRLAILLMVGGFVAVPLLESVGVSGVAVVLAGYLGVFSVLVSLFLIMGRIGGGDAVRSIARGFAALFAGEITGVLIGGIVGALPGTFDASAALVALAGVAVMYAYLFLFTDRDMAALSVVVAQTDRFEEACELIARTAKLSKREAEILPLALRGRTAERIAGEFFISKNTVDTHLRRIYAKCGVHTRQELIDLGEKTETEL
ncbi:helix-turn-helix transcriptional regulator [Adlercreutzia sp. R25]|uniref:Helix-turn-helix transcriptional regulator n=1 Tax=Adlercreutzia shanghongiae TaxID=3111773 RepID=A0ABU6IWK0_9ACTN|nr:MULTISPECIES: helix-turn-helix transcriptional regulator [unclassified Adlercreutzia]MEC4272346.1 helix-turn-helix transcriptional regulator [Adlercreutzia sp. R25]MEC4294212.1 helix-turn-helix transcriptional regulator [Adlercreutzia sp. R22]